MEAASDIFTQQRHRRFGVHNAERMRFAHWEWMVRNELNPYQAMKQFAAHLDTANGPDWCFAQRDGMTVTELCDGRTIYVGGEYEDWYDAEFCIYNDVIVRGPSDAVAIYGYPRRDFPPTDFHTATLFDNRIILIGGLGYQEDRRPGYTPVFALDIRTYQIERVNTAGENPGWIFSHAAELDPRHPVIIVSGGEIHVENRPNRQLVPNAHKYKLDLREWRWKRVVQ